MPKKVGRAMEMVMKMVLYASCVVMVGMILWAAFGWQLERV